MLGNKPVISWSVDTFHKIDLINKIIIVSEKSLIDEIQNLFPASDYPKIQTFIEGGEERSDSSYNALISSQFSDDDIFLFHDAARPFVTEEIIRKMIHNVKISEACGTYIPSADTVAMIQNSIVETIPERTTVYSAQTPQGFRYKLIKQAHDLHKQNKSMKVTDDISLVFNMGYAVSSIAGSVKNIKITTELDFRFAEFLIEDGLKC
jgi:2-C-methyl-D-erythritol 4-phosphate cytidylyltransferase